MIKISPLPKYSTLHLNARIPQIWVPFEIYLFKPLIVF